MFKSSNKKYIFDCDCGHEFSTALYNIVNGRWCPLCKNKTEKKLLVWLKSTFTHYTIKHQAKFDWCVNEKPLPFDFLVVELKLLIELDGAQHFTQVSNWTSPEDTMAGDVKKMQDTIANGFSMIRVLQDDVWFDKNDWESKLKEAIHPYETPQLVYIENGQIYANHQNSVSN